MNALDDDCSTSDGENILVIDGESGDEMMERPIQQGTKKVNKTKRRRKKKKVHEVAVGWEEDYEGHVEELDDVEDDDDDVYPPSFAGDAPDIEHGVEVEEEMAGEDDDEDVIDVDEEDGEPRLSKRGTLKSEARSKSHLLTHRYKNPYCESCVRAKMKHRKTFRGAFQRKLTKFGDLVTFDFVDDRQVLAQDYGVEKNIFVIRDRYTGMIQAYPSARKNNEAVISAVKMFMGLKEKDRLEGSPDYLPLPPPGTGDDDDDEDDQGDDNAGDDDKGDGGGDGPDGGSKSGVDPSIMAEVEELEFMGAEDAARRADLPPPPGLEQPPPDSSSKPDRVIIPESMIEHYLEGTKGDNIVYLNDDGERVKIDKIGRLYRVDERGYKIVRDSPRPAKYTPTEWQKVPHETRKEIIRVQEMEADAARERSKMERKIKDAEKTS
eukprot:s3930_g1.t1